MWYAQKLVDALPRLRGRGKQRIDYRHVIDWLVRKPGAFADYRYREELFPSSRFRMAYDVLCRQQPERAAKEYLRILHLAARESESGRRGGAGANCWTPGGRVDAAAGGGGVASASDQASSGDRGDGGGGGPERRMTPYWMARRPKMDEGQGREGDGWRSI